MSAVSSVFGPEFIQHLLTAAMPQLEALIRKVVAEQENSTDKLCVPYEEAGRMIGTSYEGIRKLVRSGRLTPTRRGRRRSIAVSELKAYIERNQVNEREED